MDAPSAKAARTERGGGVVPGWYINDAAIRCMARILRLSTDERSLASAEKRAHELIAEANLVRKDTVGRSLHRSNRHGTKLVVDYRSAVRGEVVWIGNGRPPADCWDEPPAAPPQRLECPHLPTLGEVYEITIARVGTPADQRRGAETRKARVCASCAESSWMAAVGRRRGS